MRIEKETVVCGGISDPRNSTMLKMFNFIDIGERAGSGIPNIFHVWKEENRNAPVILEEFDSDRVTLVLPLTPQKIGDKKSAISERAKNSIIQYLIDNPEGKTGEIAQFIGLKVSRTRDYLKELSDQGIVEAYGVNRNRMYRLKR